MTKVRKLTAKQVENLKTLLFSESERISNNVGNRKELHDTPVSEAKDQVDSANDSILLTTKLRFSKRETLYLKKILKALERVQAGEYGECEECGSNIAYQRLQARPTSEMCITCKEESEREESQNFFQSKSKSMAQTFTYTA